MTTNVRGWKKLMVVWVLAVGIPAAQTQTPGTLDFNFGQGGFADVTACPGRLEAMVIQPDFKPVLAGTNGGTEWVICRLTANGALDSSFNGTGIKSLFTGTLGTAFHAAIDSTGRIVVVGYQGYPALFTVVRLLPAGNLDTSFGNGGVVAMNLEIGGDYAKAVLIQPDGKILVGGTVVNRRGYLANAFARFNNNGSLDTAGFGVPDKKGKRPGWVIDDPDSRKHDGLDRGALVLLSDGRFLAGGFLGRASIGHDLDAFQGWAISRYDSHGLLDTSFGINGRITHDTLGLFTWVDIYNLGIQSDGRIIAGGRGCRADGANWDPVITRYLANGTLDTSFGVSGVAYSNDPSVDQGRQMAVQADGKIVIAALYNESGYGDSCVYRFTADGNLDLTFNLDGRSVPGGNPTREDATWVIALDPAGGIYVGGFYADPTNFTVLKYLN